MSRIAIALLLILARFSNAQELSGGVKAYVEISAPVVALTHVSLVDGTGDALRSGKND